MRIDLFFLSSSCYHSTDKSVVRPPTISRREQVNVSRRGLHLLFRGEERTTKIGSEVKDNLTKEVENGIKTHRQGSAYRKQIIL